MRRFESEPLWSADEAYTWLQTLQPRGIQLGLERTREALDALSLNTDSMSVVTIAGTNGKGSTAAFLNSIIHRAGYRVGLYTSPHLRDVSERIQVGGMRILPEDFARWARVIFDLVEGTGTHSPIPLTFFEALTVMALGYFQERETDLVILEVGMGGRLDATAVVPPLVSVITPIGLDHQSFLGDSLEAICAEKVGIVRAGCTVVTNVSEGLFRSVVGPRAFDLRCPIRRAHVDFVPQWLHEGFRYRGWIHRVGPVQLGLAGLHQADNAALACAAAESLSAHGFGVKAVHIAEGLQRARHPGRLERRGPVVLPGMSSWPAVLLEGAHNPMGAMTLAPQLKEFLPERPRVMLFSARSDKDVAGMITPLAEEVDAIVVTMLPGQPLPDLNPLEAVAQARRIDLAVEPLIPRALEVARRQAGAGGGLLVTGSLHLLGEVMELLPTSRRRAA